MRSRTAARPTAADIRGQTTYTVNLSSEARTGTWKLKVQDKFAGNVGTLQSWSITF